MHHLLRERMRLLPFTALLCALFLLMVACAPAHRKTPPDAGLELRLLHVNDTHVTVRAKNRGPEAGYFWRQQIAQYARELQKRAEARFFLCPGADALQICHQIQRVFFSHAWADVASHTQPPPVFIAACSQHPAALACRQSPALSGQKVLQWT